MFVLPRTYFSISIRRFQCLSMKFSLPYREGDVLRSNLGTMVDRESPLNRLVVGEAQPLAVGGKHAKKHVRLRLEAAEERVFAQGGQMQRSKHNARHHPADARAHHRPADRSATCRKRTRTRETLSVTA